MQVVNMSASIQSQSSTRSAQSSSRDGTGGINQPSDVCVMESSIFQNAGIYFLTRGMGVTRLGMEAVPSPTCPLAMVRNGTRSLSLSDGQVKDSPLSRAALFRKKRDWSQSVFTLTPCYHRLVTRCHQRAKPFCLNFLYFYKISQNM